MPRKFDVPNYYRSRLLSAVKQKRLSEDVKRRDLSPTLLDFGPLRFWLARHFGFCFGVENAVEIAYRAVKENPDRKVFLLSEMIHNPGVNQDLEERGVRFLMDTRGNTLIPFSELCADDIVIVPAFGTTTKIQSELKESGVDPYYYDTTCPFVEKVWKRSKDLGREGYSIIIHGKKNHEETRATFSRAESSAPTIVVQNLNEAKELTDYILGSRTLEKFWERFEGATSPDFDPEVHLKRVGVVNQTTMLATETQEIANLIKEALRKRYPGNEHFADTRDTLCYATYENQNATRKLIEQGGDLALVVGGYNSSNTSHLVELFQEAKIPVYFVRDSEELVSRDLIRHFDLDLGETETTNWLPANDGPLTISITSGASCPDRTVEQVIEKLSSFFPSARSIDDLVQEFSS